MRFLPGILTQKCGTVRYMNILWWNRQSIDYFQDSTELLLGKLCITLT
jgi:hypothetical protein